MIKKEILDTTNNFVFTALRGVQANKEYYVVMCPMRLIPRIFLYNELEIPPDMRAQRTLNKARVPEIARYITENRNEYLFSSITASIDGNIEFTPVEKEGHFSKLGTLTIPMTARFLINDGQHRRAAIEKALADNPELGLETISVVFYLDRGLKKSQQMFSDLNKHAVRPNTSLNILYDRRDDFSQSIISILHKIPIFHDLTELEKTSISNRSHKVFTLNSLYQANKDLLGKKEKKPAISENEKEICVEFWNEVYKNIKEWQDVVKGLVSPYDLRQNYVHVQGILINALGLMGCQLLKEHPSDWKNKLIKLKEINWNRDNKIWIGRSIIHGKLSKSKSNIILTTNFLKQKIGLKLSNKEKEIEAKLK
jgi:DNA sulfur modification protein DndB